jgi:hypothetical protein
LADNPQPAHITAEMWWFIEELERLEGPDTVFAGAWGRFKPGYHCDAWELWNHTDKNGVHTWRGDYSTILADDRVLGTPLEQFGAAVDWTFLSAQAGNFTNFKKYGKRIRDAWAARDPRLKGWREVLCQGDDDRPADGYDFVSWTQRTPDDTHTWHMHFSCLRKFLRTLSVFQAMISILRGETLTQWENREKTDMAIVFKYDGKYWISRGDAKERNVVGAAGMVTGDMNVVCDVHRVYPDKDKNGYPATDLKQPPRSWVESNVDAAFGKIATGGSGVDNSVTMSDVHNAIANSSIQPPIGEPDH